MRASHCIMVCLFLSPKHGSHCFSCRLLPHTHTPTAQEKRGAILKRKTSPGCFFVCSRMNPGNGKSLACCGVLLILSCSAYSYFSFSPTSSFILMRTSMACRKCLPLGHCSPHLPPRGMERVGHQGGPPVSADYRGSHLYLRRLLPRARLLVAGKEKQRLQGNRTPQASMEPASN